MKGWKGRKGLSTFVYHQGVPLCLTGHLHWNRGYVTVQIDNNKTNDDHKNNKKSTTMFVNSASLWPGMHTSGVGGGGVGVSPPVIIDYNIKQRKVIRIDCEPHPVI